MSYGLWSAKGGLADVSRVPHPCEDAGSHANGPWGQRAREGVCQGPEAPGCRKGSRVSVSRLWATPTKCLKQQASPEGLSLVSSRSGGCPITLKHARDPGSDPNRW